MTVYLAFNEAEGLDDPSNAVADTDVAVSGVCRAGFRTVDTGNGGSTITLASSFTAQSEAWVHVDIRKFNEAIFFRGDAGDVFRILDDDDNQIVNVYYGDSETVQAKSVLEGTYEAIASGVSITSGERVTYDFHVKIAADGFVKIYVNNVLAYSKEGDTVASTSATGIAKLQFIDAGRANGSDKDSTKSTWSQVLVSDDNTIGAQVYTLDPSAGTTNEWPVGDVTAVDEQGVDDGDQMQTDTALDEVTFDSSVTLSALTAPEKFTALVLSYRASLDSSATVTGLTPFLQDDGGTNTYYATSPAALTTGLADYQEIWATDPADSNEWTAAKINGYEYGYRADS